MKSEMYKVKNKDTIIGGICLGFSEYFNIDVSLIRIIFVGLFFTPIPIGTIYLILWIVLPEKHAKLQTESFDTDYNENSNLNLDNEMKSQNNNGNIIWGFILITLGTIFAFKTFFDINLMHYIKNLWPLVLIILGVWVIVRSRNDDNLTKPEDPDTDPNNQEENYF